MNRKNKIVFIWVVGDCWIS